MPLGRDEAQSPVSPVSPVRPGRATERKSDKAPLLCLLARELILSLPVTHCPSLFPLHMKYLQPTTVIYLFSAKAPRYHTNIQLLTADKLKSRDLDVTRPWRTQAVNGNGQKNQQSGNALNAIFRERVQVRQGEREPRSDRGWRKRWEVQGRGSRGIVGL